MKSCTLSAEPRGAHALTRTLKANRSKARYSNRKFALPTVVKPSGAQVSIIKLSYQKAPACVSEQTQTRGEKTTNKKTFPKKTAAQSKTPRTLKIKLVKIADNKHTPSHISTGKDP